MGDRKVYNFKHRTPKPNHKDVVLLPVKEPMYLYVSYTSRLVCFVALYNLGTEPILLNPMNRSILKKPPILG